MRDKSSCVKYYVAKYKTRIYYRIIFVVLRKAILDDINVISLKKKNNWSYYEKEREDNNASYKI